MRSDFLKFLFEDSANEKLDAPDLGEQLITLFETADDLEKVEANKQPLETALKSLGVKGTAEAFPQWCEVCFASGDEYREAVNAIFTADGLHALAQAGWIPARQGDQAMSNEPECFKLGFYEVAVAGEDASDAEEAPDLEKILKDAREDSSTEMDRSDDDLNPVENPDTEGGSRDKGVGKASDGKDPEGKPKGSKNESAQELADHLLEMTTVGSMPSSEAPMPTPSAQVRRNRLNRLRKQRRAK